MPHRTRSKSRPPSSSSSSGMIIEAAACSDDAAQAESKTERSESLDKENVKNSAFQPPSPLTSRRSKQKPSTAKKILSPTRNSQWSRSRESTSASMQPRSSPIHTGHSFPQDRDSRVAGQLSRSSETMKIDSSGYGHGDLDLMSNDDYFGPPILDLGSFDTGSPPRDPKAHRRPPERGSPSYNRNIYRYRSSPPPGYTQNQPPSGYYGGPQSGAPPPGYGYPPLYHSSGYPPDLPPWSSPRGYDYERPPPPHKPPYESRTASPISKKARRWESTPEKDTSKVRSPFRSPVSNPGSAKKFKRSPIWGTSAGTPSIGMYGSFGMMDTPGGHLDGFSPMGPSFASFEDDSPALPMEGEVLDARLSLVEDGDRMRAPPSIHQRRTRTTRLESPGLNFINELAHMPGTMPLGSPVRPSRERDFPLYYDKKGGDNAPTLPHSHPASAQRPNQTPSSTKRQIFPSPLAPSQHRSGNRRSPWYDSRQAPGPVRLEIGDIGAKNLETRRSLEGINSMVRGNAAPTRSAPPTMAHPGQAYEHNRGTPYRSDINTPVKVGAPPPSRIPPSQSRHPSPFHSTSSISGRQPVSIPSSASRYPPAQPNPNLPTPTSAHRSARVASTPSEKSTVSSGDRRNPCNCKKSKCLKLYCECFAAELVCDGCNCNDCRNNSAHEDIRNKAMKDTRAKNPNAFKPRIIARVDPRPTGTTPQSAHNMGCKCKRSECLKKYCECFQAGVMCGNKCKCVDCLNYVGSQALIDKRRKIKDHRGAEFAMQTADDAWKGKNAPPPQPRPINAPPSASGGRHSAPSPSPGHHSHGHHGQHHPPHHMMRPSPPPHHMYSPRSAPPGPPPLYMGHPSMAHPPVGYSTMGMAMHHQGSSSHVHIQHGSGNVSKGGRQSESASATTKPPPRAASISNKANVTESKSATTNEAAPESAKGIATPEFEKKVDSSAALAVAEPARLTSTTPGEPNAESVLSPNNDPSLDTVMSDPEPARLMSTTPGEPNAESVLSPNNDPSLDTVMSDPDPKCHEVVAATVPVDTLESSSVEPPPATPISGSKSRKPDMVASTDDNLSKAPTPTLAFQPGHPDVVMEIDESLNEAHPSTPTEALKPILCQVEEVVEASAGLHPVAPSEASQPVLPDVTLEITEQMKESRPASPTVAVPRTPAVRLGYDPYSSKQKRQLSPGQKEATLPYFGELPEQPKTTALAVFSFLSNDEIYNAGLVCKQWSRLAMDEELWQF